MGQPTVLSGVKSVKDIHEVIRRKQAEQAQLGKQIEALQGASDALRGVAHLLNEEEENKASSAATGNG
jgi:hypothetical protein